MRTENCKINFEINFPFDRPDKNGNIYTREAVINAANKSMKLTPITFHGDVNSEVKVIGVIDEEIPSIKIDEENKTCSILCSGTIFFGGTSCTVNEIEDNIIKDFEITEIGLST